MGVKFKRTDLQLEPLTWESARGWAGEKPSIQDAFELTFSEGGDVRESPRGIFQWGIQWRFSIFPVQIILNAQPKVSGYVNYNVGMEPEVRKCGLWMDGWMDG